MIELKYKTAVGIAKPYSASEMDSWMETNIQDELPGAASSLELDTVAETTNFGVAIQAFHETSASDFRMKSQVYVQDGTSQADQDAIDTHMATLGFSRV